MYDNEEGRGDSDSEGREVDSLDSDGPNEEQIDDLIEILESSEEEEKEEEEDVQEMMSQGEEDEPSEGEQSDETDKLNKAVDDYIGERGESEEDEDTPVVVDSREREAKILSEAVHEYFNPSTLGVETEPKEDVEPTEEGTDIDILADDEHESIDTEEDRRSISQYGEVEQASDGIKEDKIENEEIVDGETMIEDEGKDENEGEGEKPSVLVAAAMSTQRQGDAGNFDQSSTPNRFELPPERSGAEEEEPSVDDNFSFDNTSAAMASTDALSYSQTDDGYVPDAEVSEVERADRAKKDAARKKAIDDGYIPDAETSEVEQAKEVKIVHGKNKRDTVRFEEANLETTIQSATTTASIDLAASQSIDEGYLPDESEVERGETLRRRISNIDKGYLPDSLVMTEEEHGGDDIAGGEARDDDQKKLPHEEEESKQEASSQVEQEITVPADTRLDDTIDEGYLPSAGEQELSEKEDLTTTIAITHGEGKLEALQEPVKKDSIAVKEAADEASLQEAAKKDVLEVKQKEAVDSSQAITAKLLNSPHQDSVTTGEIKETAGGALSSSPASGKDNELKPAVEAKMTDTNATNLQQQQDLSRLTVAQLKDKLRELNLPVSGRKQELIDRINGHVTLKAVSLPTSQTKPAASKLPSVSSLTSTGINFDREAVSKPSPPPFNAAAPQEGYDPILASLSELAPDSLIMDAADLTATVPGIDSQSIQQEDFKLAATQDLAPAPSMDASLQTAHFTEHITEMDETIMSAEESKLSPTIKSDDKSPVSSSKNKSSLEAAEKGSWECHKCDHINAPSRTRCQGCMGWKGGHRSPSKKKKSLTFADQKLTVEASESKPSPTRKRKASSSETASESNSSPTRKSRRERKPSLKAAEELQDTPISELSHPVDSETEDEGSVDESKASSKTSSGVPTSIITKSKGGKKFAAPLPAVPEGEAVEEDGNVTMVSLKKAPADEEEEERESSKSTRAKRSTRQAKTKTAASTTSVSTRSSRRVTASKEKAADTKDEVTSKRSTKSSRQSTAAVESSEKTSSPPKRGRGRPRKVPKEDEKAATKDAQEEKEVSKKTEEATKSTASVSTRASRRGASSKEKESSKVVEKKKATESDEEETKKAKGMWKCHKCDHPNAPERARCKECLGWKGGHRSPSKKGDSSITSSRRSTRKVKKEALADESVGTRRSTRSRAKK